jgi:hypothetical protein
MEKALAANPGLEDGQRAELEAGLRDEVADLVRRGTSPKEAFRRVSKELGSPDAGNGGHNTYSPISPL